MNALPLSTLPGNARLESVSRLRQAYPAPAPAPATAPGGWSIAQCAGRLVELSSHQAAATLTFAFTLIRDAQRLGEPVAWITAPERAFYPPDACAQGVDLQALAVVRVPELRAAAGVADRLLRSGGFGLLVLDLMSTAGAQPLFLPAAYQGRLAHLAQRHDASVLCLTEKRNHLPSLGSLVSLRGVAQRESSQEELVPCSVRILKDKRHGANWRHREVYHAPAGMY